MYMQCQCRIVRSICNSNGTSGQFTINDVAYVFDGYSGFLCKLLLSKTSLLATSFQIRSKYSKDDCSFRRRNITRGVLVTINSIIKGIVSGNYFSLNSKGVSVESQVEQIENDNENAELIVIKSRDDMSDTEAVFYCIRNALAHGAFEIKGSGAKQLFLFESRRGDVLQGRIRLLKSNVDRILSISKMTREEIIKLRLKQK